MALMGFLDDRARSSRPLPPRSRRKRGVGPRASLGAWLRAAGEAGFDEEAVTALIAVARRDLEKERV